MDAPHLSLMDMMVIYYFRFRSWLWAMMSAYSIVGNKNEVGERASRKVSRDYFGKPAIQGQQHHLLFEFL